MAAVRSSIRNSIFFYKILSGWVPNNNRRASQNKKRFFMTKLTMSNMNSFRSLFWHHNKAGYRHWDQYIRHRHLSSVQEQDRKSGFHPSPFLPSPPCNTHTHFISCWVRTFILFPPAFSPSLNSQRGCNFGGKVSRTKGFARVASLFKTNRWYWTFLEHVFLSRFMPITKFLPLDFSWKSKALDPKGVNVWIASTGQMSAIFSWVWKQNSRQLLSQLVQKDVE